MSTTISPVLVSFLLMLAGQAGAALDDPYSRVERFVVVRHATGTHLLDEKLNSLNNDEAERAHGGTITEAHLTLGGVTDELRSTSKNLEALGLSPRNTCFVSSVNKRAVETATVLYDYLDGQEALFDAWKAHPEAPTGRAARILTRLPEPAFAELMARVHARRDHIAIDDRLREAFFGPVFESGRYQDLCSAWHRLIVGITPDASMPQRIVVHWRAKPPRRFVPVTEETKVMTVPRHEVGFTTVELDAEGETAKTAFLTAALEAARARLSFDAQVTLAAALGAETTAEVRRRARDFLANPDGLAAHVARCAERLAPETRFSVVLATHDSTGAQLITLLREGDRRERQSSKAYKMRVAEAVVIPATSHVRAQLRALSL